MVLPDTGDLQVAPRESFLAEPRFLEHSDRSGVVRDHGGLHTVQREVAEGGVDRLPHSSRRVAAPVVPFRDEVTEVRVRERRRRDPGQLDPPHELVAVILEDPEVDKVLGLAQPRKAVPLRVQCEEVVGPDRFPRVQEGTIAYEDLDERLGIGDF